MSSLLEKTRRVNRLIQNAAGHPVNFKEMAEVLRDVSGATVYVVSKKGKILGYAVTEGVSFEKVQQHLSENGLFPKELNERFMRVYETSANVSLDKETSVLIGFGPDEEGAPLDKFRLTVVPIHGGGERLATLVLIKLDEQFDDDDLVLAEYGATVVGMEILRSMSEKMEEEARKKAAVQMALDTLSYSEQEAVEHIFDELNGDEGLLVASKIADKVGITRSVIVNALRKFESAGVIESRSLGMKGTYIRVLNDKLFDELEKLKAR